MRRVRYVTWLVVFGACCALAPVFESSASGFGRCHQQGPPQVCIQYVYVPVYIDRYVPVGGGAPTADRDQQPRVRFLMVLDTMDRTIGEAARMSGDKVRALQESIPDEFRGTLIRPVQGEALTRDNVLDAVRNAPVNPGDTLIVYCNVHGAEDPKMMGGQNLNMWDGAPGNQKLLPRADLERVLAAKNCRLKVLITDSCFSPADRSANPFGAELQVQPPPRGAVPPPIQPPPEVTPLPPNPTQQQERLMKSLFLDHEGIISINSAETGQYSVTGVFSEAFSELCLGYYGTDAANPMDRADPAVQVTWDMFIDRLRRRVNVRFEGAKKAIEAEAKSPDQSAAGRANRILKLLDDTTGGRKKQESQDVQVFAVAGVAQRFPMPATVEAYLARTQGGSSGSSGPGAASTGNAAASAPASLPPAMQPSAPALLSPGPQSAAPQPARPANITVRTAPGSALFLEGAPTTQTAAERYFQTRPLSPGETVAYTFRAEGVVDGRKVVQTKQAVCRAGEDTVLVFENLLPAGSVASR